MEKIWGEESTTVTEEQINAILQIKEKRIIIALQGGEKLSSMDMARIYNYWRGSALIHKMKRKGYNIHTEYIRTKNTRYAVYSLAPTK